MSELDQSLSHSKWDCKYHVVIRAQTTAENHLRPDPSPIGADLPLAGAAERMPDARRASAARPRTHVHCDSPKHPVASVIGFLKGKSAIAIARLCGKERNFSGEHFRARGYAVSTVGFELEQVRQYIREQDAADGTAGQF